MRLWLIVFLVFVWVPRALPQQVQRPPQAPPASTPSPTVQTEKLEAPTGSRSAGRALPGEAGFMEPAQVKALLHKIWIAEYRINDLLTQVHPERWKQPEAARSSFSQMLQTLRTQLISLEEWRSQFEKRTDSMYLGYETYAAISAVLPRLDGVTRSITQHENPSFGVQFSHAGNQLFDLQQALEPYLAFLLRNQDQLLLATQTNLAACENRLSEAMRGRTEPAKPMKNVLPVFKGRRRAKAATTTTGAQPGEKPAKQTETKPGRAK